ncbi:hypothetical protein ACFVFS_14625 [Kitasatospora sp. NPDC057692]|uniref:hypothetical protein n=1 Tax=Kitasatospora sp. NPDC057692 TaxID=3346215 RepID=UPI0036A0AC2B
MGGKATGALLGLAIGDAPGRPTEFDDVDAIACLTGAFAGAHLGAGAWPAAWVERIEHRDELLEFGALWD